MRPVFCADLFGACVFMHLQTQQQNPNSGSIAEMQRTWHVSSHTDETNPFVRGQAKSFPFRGSIAQKRRACLNASQSMNIQRFGRNWPAKTGPWKFANSTPEWRVAGELLLVWSNNSMHSRNDELPKPP